MASPLSNNTSDPQGFGRALDIFHRAARDVGAYREFLDSHGIDPEKIWTPADFARVPAVTKGNYLRCHPLGSLLWRGEIEAAGLWVTSSGSTGTPSYWPGGPVSLEESVTLYERIFRSGFRSHQRSTLLVIVFAMGTWIGGTYSLRAALELRRRGLRMSVITPGLDAEAALAAIAALGPAYDQVVVAGYPPFVKDLLDRADSTVLRQHLSVLLAGENITEGWRDHILDRIGGLDEPHRIRLMYGTADAGVMGHETATTIAVRRLAYADPELAADLFGTDEPLPTFVEFDPQLRYTEVDEDGRFLFTVDGAMPLVRYRINDQGRVLTAQQLTRALRRRGRRLPVRTSAPGCGFLALHRRADVAASFYAVKIYPDTIRTALEHPDVHAHVTGKFVLATRADAAYVPTLELTVELRERAVPPEGLTSMLRDTVVAALDRGNGEYRRLHAAIGVSAEPVVVLEPFGGRHFRPGPKQRYLQG